MVITTVIDKPLALIVVISLTLAGCATNPVTGKTELSFIGTSEEIAIGNQQYLPSQQSQGGLYLVDPSLTDYVHEVGSRLAAVSDRSLPYEFVVLNESTPNAWALPGGKIAVNRGLLLALNNEAELAAVLGHEIVHSAARHGAKAMQLGTLLQGAVLVTSLAANDSEYSNHIVGAAQLGSQLVNTRYGRTAELESDQYGIEYMARAGYDPNAAISLQETFVAMSDSGDRGWLAGLFASHPPSVERLSANRKSVAEMSLRPDLELGTGRYQEHTAYLRSVQPAYEAFDRAQFLIAENQLDSALKTLQRARGLEPREARFYGLEGDVHLKQRHYNNAFHAYDNALKLDASYYEYYLARGLANAKLGNTAAATSDLDKSNQLLPTAIAMAELGHLALRTGDSTRAKKYYQTAMSANGELGREARLAYLRLDLPDNPRSYLTAHPKMENGVLAATIVNQSGVEVSEVKVKFTAEINGKVMNRVVVVKSLAGSAVAYSGWRLSEKDTLSNVIVEVVQARL